MCVVGTLQATRLAGFALKKGDTYKVATHIVLPAKNMAEVKKRKEEECYAKSLKGPVLGIFMRHAHSDVS